MSLASKSDLGTSYPVPTERGVNSSPPEAKIAPSPFDKEDGDVILCSSDNVHFRVHKVILSVASPWFESMFRLPQPPRQVDDAADNRVDIIAVSENSKVLENLLRICYPVDDSESLGISVVGIGDVMAAATKYEMGMASKVATRWLLQKSSASPLDVFAVASALGLESVIVKSACDIRRGNYALDAFVDPMRQMTAGQYYRLLKCRTSSIALYRRVSMLWKVTDVGQEAFVPAGTHLSTSFGPNTGGDVIIHCSDGIELHTHEILLTLASSLPLSSWPRRKSDVVRQNVRVIAVLEDSNLWHTIFSLIHPWSEPQLCMSALIAVYDAGVTYKMTKLEDFAQRQLLAMAENPRDALIVFLVAVRQQWLSGAKRAAEYVIYSPFDFYHPEMERITAKSYHDFLTYRKKWREQASRHVSKYPNGKSKASLFWSETECNDLWSRALMAVRPSLQSVLPSEPRADNNFLALMNAAVAMRESSDLSRPNDMVKEAFNETQTLSSKMVSDHIEIELDLRA